MDNRLPIFQQISQFIENEILRGNLESEDKVSSINEFAKMMKVNPATANKGLNELVNQDILYKKRGLGMFVTKDALKLIINKRKKAFNQTVLPDFLSEAIQLGLSKNELFKMIEEEYENASHKN